MWRLNNIRLALFATTLLASMSPVAAQPQMSSEDFLRSQIVNEMAGVQNPAAAQARVISMWLELIDYSKHIFPVYPAQQFTGGMSTLAGVYLDLSIAADPNVEITRFFLAHEWGHMMHGDPVKSFELSSTGQYQMLVGDTSVEDNADVYAATFMRYHHHDIDPVLKFFCELPDASPNDPHSSGPFRARKIAAIYYSRDYDPCISESDREANDATNLTQAIRTLAAAAQNNFSSVQGVRQSNGNYRSNLPIRYNERDRYCDDINPQAVVARRCTFILQLKDQNNADSEYDDLVSTVNDALPDWHGQDGSGGSGILKNNIWLKNTDADQPSVELVLRESSLDGQDFLSLTFSAPDAP